MAGNILVEGSYVRLEKEIGHQGSEEGRVYKVRYLNEETDIMTLTKIGKVGRWKGRVLKFLPKNELCLAPSQFTDDGRFIVDGDPGAKLFSAVAEENCVTAQRRSRAKRTVDAMFGKSEGENQR